MQLIANNNSIYNNFKSNLEELEDLQITFNEIVSELNIIERNLKKYPYSRQNGSPKTNKPFISMLGRISELYYSMAETILMQFKLGEMKGLLFDDEEFLQEFMNYNFQINKLLNTKEFGVADYQEIIKEALGYTLFSLKNAELSNTELIPYIYKLRANLFLYLKEPSQAMDALKKIPSELTHFKLEKAIFLMEFADLIIKEKYNFTNGISFSKFDLYNEKDILKMAIELLDETFNKLWEKINSRNNSSISEATMATFNLKDPEFIELLKTSRYLGLAYLKIDNIHQASSYYSWAFKEIKRINGTNSINERLEIPRFILDVLYEYGVLLIEIGVNQSIRNKVAEPFKILLKLAKTFGEDKYCGMALVNLGIIDSELGLYSEAKQKFDKAAAVFNNPLDDDLE
ncbi:MAG: hypothetical protein ACTSU2_02345 [Promethearchaeota archaeon]